jgi:hypothetical protein
MSDTNKAKHKSESAKADTKDGTKDGTKPTAPATATKDTKKSSASAPPKPSSSAHPRAWPGMFLLMLFSAVLGAGIATYWTSPAENTRLTQIETRFAELENASGAEENLRGDLNALAESLGQVETRVENLETAPFAPGVPTTPGAVDPRIGQLSARLSAIENAVPADLAARLNAFAPREEQEALIARMNDLEQTNNGEMLLRAGRILALSDLSRAATGSAPFVIELEAAIATLPEEPILGALRPHATEGAPVPAQLIARFPEAARQALAAERAGAADNILARLWNSFASLISIRRVGNVEGNDTGARLARAEAALGMEDLAMAVDELQGLQGAASQSMSTWLEDAEARLGIENAIAGVNARIVQTLADQSTPANTP